MIKNTLFFIKWLVILLIFININSIYAASECPIEETPEYIEKYLESVHKAVSNVNKIVSNKCSKEPELCSKNKFKIISNIQWSLNRLFTWKWYETDIEYTVQWNINEIPKQLKRDVNILQREASNLKLANVSWAKIDIKWNEICEWIDNCNFNQNTTFSAIDVILKLKQSTNQIKNIIKNQANDYNFKDEIKIYFINPEQLLQEYSKESIKICNLSESPSWEKWFFASIIERIKKINFLNKNSRNAMTDWKESYELLLGISTKQKEIERMVLARELQKQWIWWNNASTILSNLDAYNNSKKWEFPFLKWKAWFFNSLQLQINEFEEALENKFPWYKNWNPTNKEISAVEIPKEIKKLKNIQKIEININSEYNKLKSLSLTEEINSDDLINKLIHIHISVSSMVNILNKTYRISQKVCNSQKQWQWNCQ